MSDVQTRPVARGGRPSAARGGRGGFSSRGARSSRTPNTNGSAKHDQEPTSLPTLDDQGEIADLNKAHGSKIPIVKELFPDWSEVDILYALKETDGDETLTIERIIDGSISQWGEVSNQKKDRTKSKAKDTFTTTTGADAPASNSSRTARGGRPEGTRGRGRATERGARGAARGRSVQPATNGSRPKDGQPLSVPTDESNAWDTAKNTDDGGWASAAAATSWEPAAPSDPAPAASTNPPESAKSAVIPQGTSKTWASMLRQSVVVPKPAPPPPREPSAPKQEPALEPLPAATDPAPAAEPEPEPEPETIAELSAEPQTEHAPTDNTTVVVPEVALPPSDDQLTKTNLEQVADSSNPPATETAASEAADSWDPRAAAGSATATPISASQAQHQAHKAPTSGYAASAIKATERAPVPRAAAHPQRRFLDQQEAVRMPGAASQALERATVQFGAFNLNGTEDDIDGDREEPETRAQPPADSPVTQPRASLPPAPQAVPDTYTAQKPVSSLPPGAAPTGPQVPPTAPAAQQSAAQAATPQPPTQPAAQQYGRFGQAAQEQQPAFPPKPFDSYNQGSQPSAAQSHFDGFPSQQQSQTQPQSQQPGGPYSSAADQYSSYYTADQQNRLPYNAYYGQNYGQQAGQGQEGGLGSRAGFGAYGAAQGDLASQYPQSANQSRFGAAVAHDQNSGPPTPVPATTQGPPASQNHPPAHVAQQQHGSQFYGQQTPYYNQYYQNYNNPSQFGNYGGFGPYGKAGGYGQPQHYQQTPYEHASTAAGGYPQTGLHRGDSATGASLGDYGRSGSAQPGAQPGLASGGFGGIHDSFGRTSSYGTQAGQSFNAASTQPGASSNDDLKPFGDGKAAPGPSPSMTGTARPGSATNTVPSQGGGLPPQSQQGMGAYAAGFQNHLQGHGLHGSQSGSTGYGSAQGGQQNAPYSNYGGFGGGSYYGSQQQPRGWAGQYGGGGGGNY